MGSVHTMSAGISGSGAWANLASYDFPLAGRIEGVCLTVADDSDADADSIYAHFTFSSTPGSPANGDLSSLLFFQKNFQLVTSGVVLNGYCIYVKLPDVPVAAGQRLYLHGFATSGVSGTITASMHFSQNVPR